jgi:hypothetical protein
MNPRARDLICERIGDQGQRAMAAVVKFGRKPKLSASSCISKLHWRATE